jgi:GntR family transcriptional regulator
MLTNYYKDIVIDHRSNTPVCEQLVNQFQTLFSSRSLIDNQEIISYKELAEILRIKVKDAKAAYDLLEKFNFIKMKKGKAYYSKQTSDIDMVNKYTLITDKIKSMGKIPSIETLDFSIVRIDNSDLIDIQQYKDKRFLKQVRLFKADKQPFVYFVEYFSLQKFPELIEVDSKYAGRLFEDYLRVKYNLNVHKNQRNINVINFNHELSRLFQVKKDLPAFKINLVFLDDKMLPICYAYAYTLPYYSFETDITY